MIGVGETWWKSNQSSLQTGREFLHFRSPQLRREGNYEMRHFLKYGKRADASAFSRQGRKELKIYSCSTFGWHLPRLILDRGDDETKPSSTEMIIWIRRHRGEILLANSRQLFLVACLTTAPTFQYFVALICLRIEPIKIGWTDTSAESAI